MSATERLLEGKTLFVSGASRGIGLAISFRAARDGANVALIAKTAEPNSKLEGTVYTAVEAIEEAGGRALPIVGDIRDEEQVFAAVEQTAGPPDEHRPGPDAGPSEARRGRGQRLGDRLR